MARTQPGLPAVRTDNRELNEFNDGVREHLERMSGTRGDAMDRVVTLRDLQLMGMDVSGASAARGRQPAKAVVFPAQGTLGTQTSGLQSLKDAEAFAREIYNTRLFQELIAGFDDPARFAWVPQQLRQELMNSIADEASKRDTGIRKVEQIVQTATETFASRLEELTANFAGTAAGVRSLSFAYADADRAIAYDVTQVQAQVSGTDVSADTLGVGGTTGGAAYATLAALVAAIPTGVTSPTRKYYKVANPVSGQPPLMYTWDNTMTPAQYRIAGKGNTTSAFVAGVEQALRASADRSTGAEAQYTVKVTAGGAMAGFGLGAFDNGSGSASSAFLIQADKFAIVPSGYTGGLTTSPGVFNVPFGIDGTGIYMNANVRIDGNLLVTGSITSGKLGAGSVATSNFASGIEPVGIVSSVPGTLSTRSVFNTADGKLYRWNGSAYVASVPTVDLTGTLTDAQLSAISAAKITGQLTNAQLADIAAAKITGQLTNSQLADIAAAKITGQLTNSQLADLAATKITGTLTDAQLSAISAAKLTGQITSTQITDNAISTPKLAAGAVTSATIAADTITAANIAANAITSTELAAGAVVAGKIAANTIVAGDIAALTITGAQLAAGAVTAGKITAGAIVAADIAASTITGAKIAGGTITAANLVAATITASEIAASTITGAKIAGGTITAANLVAGTITATEIAASTITGAKIAAGTVTATNIAASTITANEIAANTITAGKIAVGTITATEIAGSTITAAKMSVSSLSSLTANLGTITGGSIDIGSGATSWHVDSSGNMWAGASTFGAAPFRVSSAGAITASSGTFSGALSAATGSFAGSLSAATGSFAGSLSAATGTFAGTLSAATGTFAGSLSAATGTFAGSLSAASGTFAGTLSAASGTLGTITGGTIDIGSGATSWHVDSTGNMWSGNASYASAPFKVSNAGAVTANSGTFNTAYFNTTGANAIIVSGGTGTGNVYSQNTSSGYALYGDSATGIGVRGIGGLTAGSAGNFSTSSLSVTTLVVGYSGGVTYGLDTNGRIRSTLATGTAPLEVSSTTLCANLTAAALGNAGNRYVLSGGVVAGAATGTFLANKPGANSNNDWIKITIDGTDRWIPTWPN